MSGNHFNYPQYRIQAFANELWDEIKYNDKGSIIPSYIDGDDILSPGFAHPTIKRLKEIHSIMEQAAKLAQEVVSLYESETGEDEFMVNTDKILQAHKTTKATGG